MESHRVCENKSERKIIQSDCITCDMCTNHLVLSDWRCNIQDETAEIYARKDFQIVQCQGCDDLSFRSVFTSEEVDIDEETGHASQYDTIIDLYPKRAVGKLRIRFIDRYLLPPNVQKALKETHDAICMGNEILAGAGIRLLLEAVCHEKKCKGRLEEKINQLEKKGFITSSHAKILHELRHLGNKSLNQFKIHSREDIEPLPLSKI